MKLQDLFQQFTCDLGLLGSTEATSICFDSRKLTKGCVFIAIRGAKSDGHQFLVQAAEKGAVALVIEDRSRVAADYKGAVVTVKDARQALNILAAKFFGEPGRNLFCIGVTGTNGKTSITLLSEAILDYAGTSTGVIGTIDSHLGKKVWPTELTTPDPLQLQQTLAEFRAAGARAVAMEVSSIGLVQSRSDAVPFDVAIFTNLSRDHLDYHGDMESYFQAKRKLFSTLLPNSGKAEAVAVINADDDYGQRLIEEKASRIWTYGLSESCDLAITPLDQGFFGSRFRLKTPRGSQDFQIRSPGLHNVYNTTAAIGASLACGVSLNNAASALLKFPGVRGRLESVENTKDLHVFVDYAHTNGALETVLRQLNVIRDVSMAKNKIITVFGCGGDRDRGKRPLMMKAAAEGSDLVVLTSDNPRHEAPEAILKEALQGASAADIGKRIFSILDRRQALAQAFELAQPGDVVLIAGKGHETYQQIGDVKHPFDDVSVAKELLN